MHDVPSPTGECPEVEELSAYVDGEVSPRERHRIETHVSTCSLCRNDVVEMFAVVGLMGGLDTVAPRRSLRIGSPPAAPHRDGPLPGPSGLSGERHRS